MRQRRHAQDVPLNETPSITYHKRGVSNCPTCYCRLTHVVSTLPAENGVRVRYHKCDVCGDRFKSVEDDETL